MDLLLRELFFQKNDWFKFFFSIIMRARLKRLTVFNFKRITDLFESFHACRWQTEKETDVMLQRKLYHYSSPIHSTQESFVSPSSISLLFLLFRSTETTNADLQDLTSSKSTNLFTLSNECKNPFLSASCNMVHDHLNP